MQSKKEQKNFKNLLLKEDFDAAQELLLQDIYDVEDQMEELSDEEFSKIEPHWSAVNTGEIISTPLEVLKEISDFIKFKENSTLIDLGSGHGHPSFVFGAINPSLKITGYELVEVKVLGARKSAGLLNLNNVFFETQDLSDSKHQIPHADYFYIHNPFNQEVVNKIVKKLEQLKKEKPLVIISTGGRELTPLLDLGFKVTKQIIKLGVYILT